ncbi:sulfatase-like hydrolase/transferase [Saliphagus infecundisoli]|uniref:Sulfatase-like hydrolase/transferase n=1 Tax=Saliphagus infecundisoli TaxID=1849069 RepID=A0ABD5QGE9_9EURY|nr:sulfatase-like hydrolase/transferase [Saliphagus infecundisoli]
MNLKKLVSDLDVDNVFIYVADAVRWDGLPDSISKRGVVAKTVAGSIHSPTSFATIVTAKYMITHGVTDFDCRVPDSIPTLFDLQDHQTRFVNSIGVSGSEDPIYSVLDQPARDTNDPFKSISPPFVVMERGQGGHAPYGNFEGTVTEYFDARKERTVEEIKNEYYVGIESDAKTFSQRIEELESEGLLDDTFVIYTSDHGELLGEGGMFGHNGPIRPELVYVPTVFMHPNLPEKSVDNHISHVELLPLIIDLLDVEVNQGPIDDTPTTSADVSFSFYEKQHDIPYVPITGKTRYESVWDANGGYVYPRASFRERSPGFIGDLFFAPSKRLARKRAVRGLKSYISGREQFGDPPGKAEEFDETLGKWINSTTTQSSHVSLGETAKDRLEELGYLK